MNTEPLVYGAVRAVGILRPEFQGSTARPFVDRLDVIGTAFWLKNERILITCAHVVVGLLNTHLNIAGLLVVGNRGSYTRAVVSIVDLAHDLAVLATPEIPESQIQIEAQDGLQIAESFSPVGTPICYAGFPLGNQLLNSTHAPTYAEGVIGAEVRHQLKNFQIQITGPVINGFSGAPIVDKSSGTHVIGVLSSSPSQEAGTTGLFMATASTHLAALAKLAISGIDDPQTDRPQLTAVAGRQG